MANPSVVHHATADNRTACGLVVWGRNRHLLVGYSTGWDLVNCRECLAYWTGCAGPRKDVP